MAAAPGTDSIVLEEEIDPNYVPLESEVIEYAKWLGMDLEVDKDLYWVAREGLMAPLPKEWKPCKTTDTGDVYYFNFESGESTWDHPCDGYYKRVYEEEKKKKEVSMKESNDQKRTKAKQDVDILLGKADKKKKKGPSELTTLLVPGPLSAPGSLPSPTARGGSGLLSASTSSLGSLSSSSLGNPFGGNNSLRKAPLPDIKESQPKSMDSSSLGELKTSGMSSRERSISPAVHRGASPALESSGSESSVAAGSGKGKLSEKIASIKAKPKIDDSFEHDEVSDFKMDDVDDFDDSFDAKVVPSSRTSSQAQAKTEDSRSRPSAEGGGGGGGGDLSAVRKANEAELRRLEDLHRKEMDRKSREWEEERNALEDKVRKRRSELQRDLSKLEDEYEAKRSELADKYPIPNISGRGTAAVGGMETILTLETRVATMERERDKWSRKADDLSSKVEDLEAQLVRAKSDLSSSREESFKAEESFLRQLKDQKEKLSIATSDKEESDAQVALWKKKFRELETQSAAEIDRLSRASASSSTLGAEDNANIISGLQSSERKLKAQVVDLQGQLDASTETLKRSQRAEESLRRDVASLEALHMDKLSRKDKTILEVKEEAEVLKSEIVLRKRRVEELTTKIDELERANAGMKRSVSLEALASSVNTDNSSQLRDAEDTIATLKADEKKLKQQITKLEEQLEISEENSRRSQRTEESLKRDIVAMEAQHSDKIARKDKAIADVREELATSQELVDKCKKDRDVAKADVSKLQDQVKVLEQLCRSNQLAMKADEDVSRELLETRAELQALKRSSGDGEADAARLKKALDDKVAAVRELETEVDTLRAQLRTRSEGSSRVVSDSSSANEETDRQIDEFRGKTKQLNAEIERLKGEIEEKDYKSRVQEQKFKYLEEEFKQAEAVAQRGKLRLSELQEKVDDSEREISSLKSALRSAKQEKEGVEEVVQKLESKVRELQQEIANASVDSSSSTASSCADGLQEALNEARQHLAAAKAEGLAKETLLSELQQKCLQAERQCVDAQKAAASVQSSGSSQSNSAASDASASLIQSLEGQVSALQRSINEMKTQAVKNDIELQSVISICSSSIPSLDPQAAPSKAVGMLISRINAMQFDVDMEREKVSRSARETERLQQELVHVRADLAASEERSRQPAVAKTSQADEASSPSSSQVGLISNLEEDVRRQKAEVQKLQADLGVARNALAETESNGRLSQERADREAKELRSRCDFLEAQYKTVRSTMSEGHSESFSLQNAQLLETVNDLHRQLTASGLELSKAMFQRDDLQRQVQDQEREVQGLTRRLSLQSAEVQRLHEEAMSSVSAGRDNELQNQRLKGELANLQSTIQLKDREISTLQANVHREREDKARLTSEVVTLTAACDELRRQVLESSKRGVRESVNQEQTSQSVPGERELDKLTAVVSKQQSAVLRLEEKLKGAEDVIAALQAQPVADEQPQRVSAASTAAADRDLVWDSPHLDMDKENRRGQRSDGHALSPLLKSIWKQFDGLAKETKSLLQGKADKEAYPSSRLARNLGQWETKLEREMALVAEARQALQDDKLALRKQQSKLAIRRETWKDQTRELRPDDKRARQVLRSMCKSLNDEADRMNRAVRQSQLTQTWLVERTKKLEKLSRNINIAKQELASRGFISDAESPGYSEQSELLSEFDILGRELDSDVTLLDDEMGYSDDSPSPPYPDRGYKPAWTERASSRERDRDRDRERERERDRDRDRRFRDRRKEQERALPSPRRSASPSFSDRDLPPRRRDSRLSAPLLRATSLDDLHMQREGPPLSYLGHRGGDDGILYSSRGRGQSSGGGGGGGLFPASRSSAVSASTGALHERERDQSRRKMDLDFAAQRQERQLKQQLHSVAARQNMTKDAYDSHAFFLNDLRKEIDKFSHVTSSSSTSTGLRGSQDRGSQDRGSGGVMADNALYASAAAALSQESD